MTDANWSLFVKIVRYLPYTVRYEFMYTTYSKYFMLCVHTVWYVQYVHKAQIICSIATYEYEVMNLGVKREHGDGGLALIYKLPYLPYKLRGTESRDFYHSFLVSRLRHQISTVPVRYQPQSVISRRSSAASMSSSVTNQNSTINDISQPLINHTPPISHQPSIIDQQSISRKSANHQSSATNQ